jgi:hypothetical protein
LSLQQLQCTAMPVAAMGSNSPHAHQLPGEDPSNPLTAMKERPGSHQAIHCRSQVEGRLHQLDDEAAACAVRGELPLLHVTVGRRRRAAAVPQLHTGESKCAASCVCSRAVLALCKRERLLCLTGLQQLLDKGVHGPRQTVGSCLSPVLQLLLHQVQHNLMLRRAAC